MATISKKALIPSIIALPAATLACVLSMQLASSAAGALAATDGDSVKGSVTMSFGAKLRVDASSGPNGEDAQGTISYREDTGAGVVTLEASVSCLVVRGNVAIAGGFDAAKNIDVYAIAVDNPDKKAADQAAVPYGYQMQPPDQAMCNLILDNLGTTPVQNGKITVVDDLG